MLMTCESVGQRGIFMVIADLRACHVAIRGCCETLQLPDVAF